MNITIMITIIITSMIMIIPNKNTTITMIMTTGIITMPPWRILKR